MTTYTQVSSNHYGGQWLPKASPSLDLFHQQQMIIPTQH